MRKLLVFMMLVSFRAAIAQPDSSAKLQWVRAVSAIAKDSLKLHTGEEFYTEWSRADRMFAFVYASRRDSVMTPQWAYRYFGDSHDDARKYCDSLERSGLDAMLSQYLRASSWLS